MKSTIPKIVSTNWYDNKKYWEFKKGTIKDEFKDDDAKKADVTKFTRMIWKGYSSVGFGIKDTDVVAWFCPDDLTYEF